MVKDLSLCTDIYSIKDIYYIMHFDFFSRKKFKCTTCGEKFKTETELQGHRKIEHDMKGV
jgi:hypothetical protein